MTWLFTDAEVAEDRALAESRMLDEFAVMVSTGGWVYDPELGEDVEELALLFTTPARVKASSGLVARESEAGGRTVTAVTREFHIPVGSPPIPVGALALPVSIHPTSDPTLTDARLRLAGPAPGSQTTARRLEVEEVLT